VWDDIQEYLWRSVPLSILMTRFSQPRLISKSLATRLRRLDIGSPSIETETISSDLILLPRPYLNSPRLFPPFQTNLLASPNPVSEHPASRSGTSHYSPHAPPNCHSTPEFKIPIPDLRCLDFAAFAKFQIHRLSRSRDSQLYIRYQISETRLSEM
jgi:hypothetical protein